MVQGFRLYLDLPSTQIMAFRLCLRPFVLGLRPCFGCIEGPGMGSESFSAPLRAKGLLGHRFGLGTRRPQAFYSENAMWRFRGFRLTRRLGKRLLPKYMKSM